MADRTTSVVMFRNPTGPDQPVAAFTGPTAERDAGRVAQELGDLHHAVPVPIHDGCTRVVQVWECRATVLGESVTVHPPLRLAHALLVRPEVDVALLDRVDVQVDADAAGLAAAVFGHRVTYVVAHSATAAGARKLARDRAEHLVDGTGRSS